VGVMLLACACEPVREQMLHSLRELIKPLALVIRLTLAPTMALSHHIGSSLQCTSLVPIPRCPHCIHHPLCLNIHHPLCLTSLHLDLQVLLTSCLPSPGLIGSREVIFQLCHELQW
jgi:hypothetical protein